MEQKKHSQKFLRQRKFLMIVPLLVLPFMTSIFWALGGGKVSDANAEQVQEGFNMQLPDASLKDDKPLDKLSYYEKAASDSAKLQELMKNDPYYNMEKTDSPIYLNDTSLLEMNSESSYSNLTKLPYNNSLYGDPNETKVYKKLAELNNALNSPTTKETKTEDYKNNFLFEKNNNYIHSSDADRINQMMEAINQKNGDDPEMQQLNGMLEKILEIQHPDQEREKIKQTSEARRGEVFAVAVNNKIDPVSFFGNGSYKLPNDTGHKNFNQQNGFYSLDAALELNNNQNAIEAVIQKTQTIVNGSTIKLRLVNDVYINGVLVPKETFVFGTAALNGERLGITIKSIRYKTSLFPVELSVFDLDGMDGLYIPGAITRDVAKESADRAIQDIGFTSLNPPIGVQAAGAGIEAAKTLFSKKVKLIKVTVKAGYHVLLRDEKQKQSN